MKGPPTREFSKPTSAENCRTDDKRASHSGGRGRKVAIVALARKLLVALWKYVTAGVVIEGVAMTAA
jgi:hypothetical protein